MMQLAYINIMKPISYKEAELILISVREIRAKLTTSLPWVELHAAGIYELTYAPLIANQKHGVMVFDEVLQKLVYEAVDKEEDAIHAEAIALLDLAVEAFFLVKCGERSYKHVESATKYIGGTNLEWHNDGVALRDWVTACWEYCYLVIATVHAGTRTIPTADELIAELPVLVWPI